MPSTFELSGSKPPIPITVADGINIDEERLLAFPAFSDWLKRLKTNLGRQRSLEHAYEGNPWELVGINIHHITEFGQNKIGFMTIEALLKNNQGRLDRVIFLRGGSVAILIILRPRESPNERYVILTGQPRLGVCSTGFLEIPAGMLDDKSRDVRGNAIQAIEDETGLKVPGDELIDMTALALSEAETKEDLLPAMYASPANLDEYMALLLWEKELDRKEIEALKNKLTGERSNDRLITLRVREFDVLWKEGARDAKTLAAYALYQGLNREGKIEEQLKKIRMGSLVFA